VASNDVMHILNLIEIRVWVLQLSEDGQTDVRADITIPICVNEIFVHKKFSYPCNCFNEGKFVPVSS
jgi:hypothetical protein